MASHTHEHEPITDAGLRRRVRVISLANYAIGAAEFVAGLWTNSSTLSMAGVHDGVDGKLYAMKKRAMEESDPTRKLLLRRRVAVALIGLTVSFGLYELSSDVNEEDHEPEAAAAVVGVVAAGANIGATMAVHGKRHLVEARDTWQHVALVDLPASLTTLVIAPLSVIHPELDPVGTVIHMGLATAVGVSALRDTAGKSAHS